MGIELAIVAGALGVAKSVGDYNQAKSAARATAKEGQITAENRKKEIQQLAARQKMSFLQAGLELEGTPQAVIQDTYTTGIEDLQSISSSYNKRLKNMQTQARANLFGSLASSATSALGTSQMTSGLQGGLLNSPVSESGGILSSGISGG